MTRTAILSLHLSHFRSWHAAVLDAEGESVALFGPNGAGKTNMLEAASLLVPGRGLRRAATDALIRTPARLGWRVAALVATGGREAEIVTAVEGAEATRRSVIIDDKPAAQAALGGLVRQVWLTPAMDRLWTGTPGERRGFLDRVTLGFDPGHGESSLAYEKAMRERNRLLRDGRADRGADAWLDALEARMATAGARIARARADALVRLTAMQDAASEAASALFPKAGLAILGEMESRFAQVIRDASDPEGASDDLDSAESEEASGLARALAEGRARDAVAGRTLEGPHRSDLDAVYAEKAMPARACSTGEQKALLISLCLANARALAQATGAAPILLLDEVAAHLDADRRKALYGEIGALGAQALVTGTSAALFDGFAARRVAVAEADGASRLDAA